MKLLALDQAKRCGYAVFDNDKLVDYGTKILGGDDLTYENILLPASNIIKELIYSVQPDIVLIEDIQYEHNMLVYQKLAMLKGVLLKLFKEIDIKYLVVQPSKWKAYLKIKGKKRDEQKLNTINMMQETFNLTGLTSDPADAIGIAYYYIKSKGGE